MREDTGIDQKKKKIIREYCKQLYAHTFNNLEKLCCFLWKAQATKTHHVEAGNLNSFMTIKETVFIV